VRGLGKGAFGQVFMVKDTQESKIVKDLDRFYAMKIIHKDSITCEEEKINTLS
jgi:serine/threonine protein kinase